MLGATWRFRWLVLAVVALFAGLGFLYAFLQSSDEEWRATATVIVEDPRATALFEAESAQRPERYLQNQVEILRSDVVAQRASEVADEGNPGVTMSAGQVRASTSIGFDASSDVIEITFTGPTAEVARAGANAVAVAYQDVRRSEAARNFAASIGQLDASIEESEEELTQLQLEIDQLLAGSPARQQLLAQFDEAIADMVDLQDDLLVAGEQTAALIRTDLEDIFRLMQRLQLLLEVGRGDAQLAVLTAKQNAAIARLSALTERRDQIEVDSELAGSGVVLYSPALGAVPVGSGLFRTMAVALVLGGLAGSGLAYALALRRRRFFSHTEPELVLEVPMLAEIPDFREERIRFDLPVRNAPFSAAAEGFRFVAGAISHRLGTQPALWGQAAAARWSGGARPDRGLRSITFASALSRDGKSVVAANVSVALAREGNNVLVIDADFGDQRLSRLLGYEATLVPGLTEIIAGQAEPADAIVTSESVDGGRLSVLGRGDVRTPAADLLRSESAAFFFGTIRGDYDVVIVDTPPLLHVAYASTLLGYTDAAVVVIPHGSNVAAVEELRDRVDLVDTFVLGYVYNKAPLRRKISASEGSMQDIVGSGWPTGTG